MGRGSRSPSPRSCTATPPNAASAVNNWSYYATVYYNSGCNGSIASQSFGAYGAANFTATMKNNNASLKWPSASGVFYDCAKRDQF